jgi:hypothetical protein
LIYYCESVVFEFEEAEARWEGLAFGEELGGEVDAVAGGVDCEVGDLSLPVGEQAHEEECSVFAHSVKGISK